MCLPLFLPKVGAPSYSLIEILDRRWTWNDSIVLKEKQMVKFRWKESSTAHNIFITENKIENETLNFIQFIFKNKKK